jgi:ABC-2 type transport system permease protein
MLRALLAKDLRRAWRNPLPWLINLLVPLVMTALIGLVFGGHSDSGALGRIRFAVVDEDQSLLSDFLRGSSNQREGGKYLEPVFLDRESAMRQILDNQISAVVIIPTNFMRNYFLGREAVSLELIKNPAQSIHPAVLEELLGAVVTAMNAVARNFKSEFPEWQAVFEGKTDYHKLSALIERAGDKLKTVKDYVNPPLVSYSKEDGADKAAAGKSSKEPTYAVFAYLLIGMTAMFLVFLAGNAMTDLHREIRLRTMERYNTLHQQLLPFVASKVVFVVVILLICSAVMLGGGGLMFRIQWHQPVAMAALMLGYACFIAGLVALLVALVPDEHRATALITIVGMTFALGGGCMFPANQLPAFLRNHITPLLPSAWFVEAARNIEFGATNVAWGLVALKMIGLGALLIGLAAFLFRRRFSKGIQA